MQASKQSLKLPLPELRTPLERPVHERDTVCLRPFGALNDCKLHIITLFERLVPIVLNAAVMYENIRS